MSLVGIRGDIHREVRSINSDLLINRNVFFNIGLAQINHYHHESEEVEDKSESESQQRPTFGQRRVDERRLSVAAIPRRLRFERFDDSDGAEGATEKENEDGEEEVIRGSRE